MSECIICGKKGDKHHIIHKCENGLDTPLNIVYLCPEHHRGPHGVHNNKEFDLELKLELQRRLEEMFPDRYYSLDEIREKTQLRYSQMRKFEKSCRLYKYGYNRNDIIYFLMGGNIFRYDLQDELMIAQSY